MFEGDIAYPHVKEDYAITLMKCKQWIQATSKSCPVAFEYSNNEKYQYLIMIEYEQMMYKPTITYIFYSYTKTSGNGFNSKDGTINAIQNRTISFRTALGDQMNTTCKNITVDLILSCEPL